MSRAEEEWNQHLVIGSGTTDFEIMWKQLKKHLLEREEKLRPWAEHSAGYMWQMHTHTNLLLDLMSTLEKGGSII